MPDFTELRRVIILEYWLWRHEEFCKSRGQRPIKRHAFFGGVQPKDAAIWNWNSISIPACCAR